MKRPIGLILSAIVLSLAAFFLLLMTALTVFAGIFAKHQPPIAAAPHLVTYFVVAISAFYAVLAIWAILTVIGILRLRSWGRYSILIIGGGLAVVGILATAFSLLFSHTMLPALQAQQSAVDPHLMTLVFLFVAAIYLFIAAVGIWWLIYFNLRFIREIFSHQAMLVPSLGSVGTSFSRTPTAIQIIGGFFLFSSVCCLLCVFLPFPAFLLGFIIPPKGAHILYLCFAILTASMGYGLLRLNESARLLTITFQIFGCVNIALAILPWYQRQFCLYMTRLIPAMPTMTGQPQAFFNYSAALVVFSCIWGLIVYGLVIWLLYRHRASFQPPRPPPPMLEA
jgi:hypothetical protein